MTNLLTSGLTTKRNTRKLRIPRTMVLGMPTIIKSSIEIAWPVYVSIKPMIIMDTVWAIGVAA